MNILILTAKCGMGHYTASMALKQELENEDVQVQVIDFFEVIFPRINKIIYGIFNFLVSKCSSIYNFFYKFSANTNFTPFKKIMKKRIEKIIEQENINIVISTFPVCSKYISAYKKINNKKLKLYTYITDIEVNKEWITNETDMYFVASEETKMQLIHNGILENKIKIVGIPVRKEFKKRKIIKNKNEIVIMGGGLGLIPKMKKILNHLVKNKNIHITLIAGKNQKLLKKYYNRYDNMTVIGYTNEVYKYVEKAELIITKAGGITLFEAIHTETPMYILYPFLSQEIGNARFIEKNNIGKIVWSKTKNVTQDILNLLNSKIELNNMRKNMKKIKNKLEKINVIDIYQKGA